MPAPPRRPQTGLRSERKRTRLRLRGRRLLLLRPSSWPAFFLTTFFLAFFLTVTFAFGVVFTTGFTTAGVTVPGRLTRESPTPRAAPPEASRSSPLPSLLIPAGTELLDALDVRALVIGRRRRRRAVAARVLAHPGRDRGLEPVEVRALVGRRRRRRRWRHAAAVFVLDHSEPAPTSGAPRGSGTRRSAGGGGGVARLPLASLIFPPRSTPGCPRCSGAGPSAGAHSRSSGGDHG